MDDNIDQEGVQAFGLIDSLDQAWLKLPLTVMRDVGPATLTLGGLLKISNKETFVAAHDIASAARVPLATTRKHLEMLSEHGWIENKGRGCTRGGRPRRTTTRTLTAQCRNHLEPYAILPWWACCFICADRGKKHPGRLRWSTKALLSIVMGRLATLKAAANEAAEDGSSEEIFEWIDCYMGIENRFRFSLSYLERQTGLTQESVVSAKRDLNHLGIVEWSASESGIDCIRPRWDFQVIKTPADQGFFRVSFRNTEG